MIRPADASPVASAQNARVKRIAAALKGERCYWWEGVRFFEELLKEDRRIRLLVITEGMLRTRRRQIDEARAEELLVVTEQVFGRIAGTVESRGVGGLIDIGRHSVDDLTAGGRPVFYLAGLQDPGNVGTVVRIADAFAFGGIFYERRGASPYGEKAVRASAGSIVRTRTIESDRTALDLLRKAGYEVCLLTARSAGAAEIGSITDRGSTKLVFVLGREGSGLDFDAGADRLVYIPTPGNAESLNVAVAAGIAAYCATAGKPER